MLTAGAALSALAAILAAPPADVPLGRLPSSVVPAAYRIDLTEDPAQPGFTGHVEIEVRLTEPVRTFYLNGRDLDVTRVSLRTGSGEAPAAYEQVSPLGVARIDLKTTQPAGAATLVLDYKGRFQEGSHGLYHLASDGAWYSYTNLEEAHARRVFPAFDEPGFKTPFTISLTTPPELRTVSNAPEVATEPAPGGWVRHRFAPTPPLPTYLVAMMAGPFVSTSTTIPANAVRRHPLNVRVVATAPQADKLAFAARETGPIVELLEGYFASPFPFAKLDQIATPVWQGETAMENAGADTYADNVLLLDRGATTAQKRAFGMVVGHELSHQWFGDLVTPVWWSDLWLNESFAEWMGYRIGAAWKPELRIGDGAVVGALQAMELDSLLAGRPIRQTVTTVEDAETVLDEVTYDKGAQVITQTAAYLGDATFRDGVRLHLRRHAFGSADSDQFFAALSDAAHDPRIAASMKSFVGQQGVPLLTFAQDHGAWRATQSRYALLGETPPRLTWVTPLCVRPIDGPQTCVLADETTTLLPKLTSTPFMPNAGGRGYYRFELPQAAWLDLIARMDALPASEALTADDSLWASFAAGRASPALLIEAARRMSRHPVSSVVLDGAERLAAWRRHDLIAGVDLPAYRRLMSTIYDPVRNTLGLDLRAGVYSREDPDRRALREGLTRVAALEARDRTLRAKLDAAATAYLSGHREALDQGFLSLALSVHLQMRDLAAARDMLARASTSDDVVFKRAALHAVGDGARVETAADVASLVFAEGLTSGIRGRLAGELVARPDTRPIAQPVVLARAAELGDSIPTVTSFDFTGSFDQACTEPDAAAVEAALRPRTAHIYGGALSLDRMVERVRTCAILKARRGGDIARSLHSY